MNTWKAVRWSAIAVIGTLLLVTIVAAAGSRTEPLRRLVIATLAESADPDDTRPATEVLAESRFLLGRAYWLSAQPARAIDLFNLSAVSWERLRGENAPEMAEALAALADAHVQRREYAFALPQLEKLVKILPAGIRRSQAQMTLASVLRQSGGDRERASALEKEALGNLGGEQRRALRQTLDEY
jgi:tetratricopeptide (TPR) repeat protein